VGNIGKSQLPAFEELYGIRGAAVCGAEIAKGIAIDLGLYVSEPDGLTADTDTDLYRKAVTACSLMDDYDFVFVHINGADEASHRYDVQGKIQFIEKIDREFIAYILDHVDEKTNLIICADHATSPVSGKHSRLDVSYIVKSELRKDRIGRKLSVQRNC
jgi:2,3-bisphosphoglycerate-independent phosphoglycerate mutase